MKEPTKCEHGIKLENDCWRCDEEAHTGAHLERRIARLERIVKSGLDFEHPEIIDEIKDL
jgi:hypothetical protein